MSTTPKVIIVGGGWAGLSAAVTLVKQGMSITLLESARQLGGRARRVAFEQQRVDNGQHLLIGAYRDTLTLMRNLGIDISKQLIRTPLSLTLRSLHGRGLQLSVPKLPAPLHLLVGLLRAKGFTVKERLRALQFGLYLFTHRTHLKQDMSVAELLARYNQPKHVVHALWEPLCIAMLNTPIAESSATIFLRILRDSFIYQRQDSDLLCTRSDLGCLLPDPATDFIEQHGGAIHLGQRVTKLNIDNSIINAVSVGDEVMRADHVILAVPPHICHDLLAAQPRLNDIAQKLKQLRYKPICTVYLQYPKHVTLDTHIIGMLGTMTQWVFDRRMNNQPGLMAAVISSSGAHMELDNTSLINKVTTELATLYPQWPSPTKTFVIREKRATFASCVDVNALRPENTTPVQGLWLAGDYTATGYPATLEGAVRSGLQCAQHVLATLSHDRQ